MRDGGLNITEIDRNQCELLNRKLSKYFWPFFELRNKKLAWRQKNLTFHSFLLKIFLFIQKIAFFTIKKSASVEFPKLILGSRSRSKLSPKWPLAKFSEEWSQHQPRPLEEREAFARKLSKYFDRFFDRSNVAFLENLSDWLWSYWVRPVWEIHYDRMSWIVH